MGFLDEIKQAAFEDELLKIAGKGKIIKDTAIALLKKRKPIKALHMFAQQHPAGLTAGTIVGGFGADVAGGYLGSHSGVKHGLKQSAEK